MNDAERRKSGVAKGEARKNHVVLFRNLNLPLVGFEAIGSHQLLRRFRVASNRECTEPAFSYVANGSRQLGSSSIKSTAASGLGFRYQVTGTLHSADCALAIFEQA